MAVQGEDGGEGRATRGTRVAVIVGFALLIMAGLAAIVTFQIAARSEARASNSLDIRLANVSLLGAVRDAESGQRGFLLTADARYLEPYDQARTRLPVLRKDLRRLTRDNPTQQARLNRLDIVLDAKMAELRDTVDLARGGRADDALRILRTYRGRALMLQIRRICADIDTEERGLLSERARRAGVERALSLGIIVMALAITGFLALVVIRAERAQHVELARQNGRLNREIKEREDAQAQLRQAQKMEAVGQLTGGIAHDFNNMLAIIIGNLDILRRRLAPDNDRLSALVENALAGANRAAALTQRLLAFSRLQPLDPRPTDVNKCVSDMSEMLRRALGETIVVETVLGGGLWRASIDHAQLESAILNLAVNARDAMPDGGRLTLETSNAALDRDYADAHPEVVAGQYVLVAISDSGHGMTTDVARRAFDPFFTTKPVGSGTGLGLSQVHGFIKQSRGHIKIYSEIGVGTTIKLYLPRDVSGAVPMESAPPAVSKPIDKRFAVLIAEDDREVLAFAATAARDLGFEVVEAENAAMALEHLDLRPDITVLLTDVVMPVMDGGRLVEAALHRRPDLRVVYMTGYTRNAIVHNGVLDAQTRLITKPFTVAQLDRELRTLLADLI